MTEPIGSERAAYRLRLIAHSLDQLYLKRIDPALHLAIVEVHEVARRLEATHQAEISRALPARQERS